MSIRQLALQTAKAIKTFGGEGTSLVGKAPDAATLEKAADAATRPFAPKSPSVLASMRQKFLPAKGTSVHTLGKELRSLEDPFFRVKAEQVKAFLASGEVPRTRQGRFELNSAFRAIDGAQLKLLQLEDTLRTAPPGLTLGVKREALVAQTQALAKELAPPGFDRQTIARVPLHTVKGGNQWQYSTEYSPLARRLNLNGREMHGYAHPDGYGRDVARFSGEDMQLAYRKALTQVGARVEDFPIHSTNDIGNTYSFNYRIGLSKDPAKTKAFYEALMNNLDSLSTAFRERGARGLTEARTTLHEGAAHMPPLRHVDPYPFST